MENKKDEQVIYLKDLLFAALHRWRAILIITTIAALSLGGFKGLSDWRSMARHADNDAAYQAALEQYELDTKDLTSKIELLQTNVDEQRDYMANSVLMNLDPYGFYEAHVQLYLDTGYQINTGSYYQDTDKTAAVLAAYESAFLREDAVAQLAEAAGTTSPYMRELISCAYSSTSGTLTVNIRCADKETADALVLKLTALAESFRQKIASSIAEHTASTLEQGSSYKMDLSLANVQKDAFDQLAALQESLDEVTQEKDALAPPAQYSPNKTSVIKKAFVFAVAGGILGAALSVCVIWVAHITSDKVFSAKALHNRTGVKVLGCLACAKKCPVDRWLCKAEGRSINDTQSQAALLAVDIRNRCGEARHLLVAGNADTVCREQLLQALRSAMPGVQITDAPALLNDAQSLENLADCDTVLLAEQCDVSRYSQVIAQLALICDYKKALVGCILVNG